MAARPFGGALLALAVICGAITLYVKPEWQDMVFEPLGVKTKLNRYAVLGITIFFMLISFVSTDKEEADELWAKGNKSEAVELYVSELEGTFSPNPEILARVIEFYFENGNKEKAEEFCNMAIETDVELSPQSKEIRDFVASVREEYARKVEQDKLDEEAKNKVELAKREAEQENQKRESEEETRKRLDTFIAALKVAEVTIVKSVRVQEISNGIWEAEIEVRNNWHIKPYQVRLQDAQNLWSAWAKIASPQEPDSARIKIVDINGNEVGGSRVLAGSLIWVQEN
ncbi:hypothetical protein Enr10x_01090 [Gimesia panareensis]|uniref:Tetratricopeptide repeat protein n=2 Tax=Gimesia panareensis TaxID=2527978 RepID=A0A517PZN3_9PLAN|nr:hypothetical protein Enr10x_01090 [Gimesia panareensis]